MPQDRRPPLGGGPDQAICYAQVVSDPTGSRLALLYFPEPDHFGQIVELDLSAGQIRPVPLDCEHCQYPGYSPSGNHIQVLELTSHRSTTVWVDGRRIAKSRGRPEVSWFSDSTIAFVSGDSLQLINVEDDTRIRTPLPSP